jgi:hypothetical protein
MNMAKSVTQKFTGMKRTASGAFAGRSNGRFSNRRYPYFVLCVENSGHEESLIVGKVYRVIRPEKFDKLYDLRVIDEEGEDYLYSASRFVPVELPPRGRKAVVAASLA